MTSPALEIEHKGAVAWIWMNRPEVHNAFDANLITALTDAFTKLAADGSVRVIVLGARGRSFSAGAQVQWMQQQGAAPPEENAADARKLAGLFQTIAECPKPTVARVQGAALGGGVGLISACDVVIASQNAVFATSEVRLGLIPATIGPYVVRAIGERHARRLFLTAERIEAQVALQIGLVHIITESDGLDARTNEVIEALLLGAPGAQAEAKSLIGAISGREINDALIAETVQRISTRRATPEAAEGLSAFLAKRPAAWGQQP